jgi:hypothetical protein
VTEILTPEMGNSGSLGGGVGIDNTSVTQPYGVDSTSPRSSTGWEPGVQYNYTYPLDNDGKELDLRPGSQLHGQIIINILNRARQSYSVMQRRHEAWNKIDDTLTAYITPDELDKEIKRKDKKKPVNIVIPYSFATLETILTYFSTAFLQNPIFQFDGNSGEDQIGAKLLELCVEAQMRRSGGSLALHTMWRDSIAYSIGCIAAGWKRENGHRVVEAVRPQGVLSKMLDAIGGNTGRRKKMVPELFYEGCDLINIDPYLILPDPNQPIHKIEAMEFFGWIEEKSQLSLLEEELWEDSDLFNVRYLSHTKERYTEFTIDPSRRAKKYGLNQRRKMYGTTNSKTLINMYINLVPKDWNIGSSEYPEKWLFQVADGLVITKARPLDLVHNRFPVVLSSPDFDGYSVAPVSRLEMIDGLQEVLNFLFNSHMMNVRRSVNNMFVVDPSLVNIPDFDDPSGGLMIRLRRAAWGRGVQNVMEQLQVVDVTARNVQDAFQVMELGARVTGATDNAMGQQRKGSARVSATESRGQMQNVANRMERMASVTSAMAMNPLAYMLAFHTQQLMSQDMYVKVVGENLEALQAEYGAGAKVKVSPFDILVQFGVIPRDGSVPGAAGQTADQWVNLYQILAQNQVVAAEFDMVRIFKHIARLMGAKDVSSFAKVVNQTQTQVQTDQAVADQVQRGNLVPINPEQGVQEQGMPGTTIAAMGR